VLRSTELIVDSRVATTTFETPERRASVLLVTATVCFINTVAYGGATPSTAVINRHIVVMVELLVVTQP